MRSEQVQNDVRGPLGAPGARAARKRLKYTHFLVFDWLPAATPPRGAFLVGVQTPPRFLISEFLITERVLYLVPCRDHVGTMSDMVMPAAPQKLASEPPDKPPIHT